MASIKMEAVRCIACRHEYELPPRGVELCCPECGSLVWVSARIPLESPDAIARYETTRA